MEVRISDSDKSSSTYVSSHLSSSGPRTITNRTDGGMRIHEHPSSQTPSQLSTARFQTVEKTGDEGNQSDNDSFVEISSQPSKSQPDASTLMTSAPAINITIPRCRSLQGAPNEILRLIGHFLEPAGLKLTGPPCAWEHQVQLHTDKSHKYFGPLTLVSRHFRELYTPFLYKNLVMGDRSICNLLLPRETLVLSNALFHRNVTSIVIPNPDGEDLLTIFRLPSIRDVTILRLTWELEASGEIDKYSLTCSTLRFVNSYISVNDLTEILSLPKQLRELWYDIALADAPNFPDEDDVNSPLAGWTSASLTSCLSPQAASLEKLMFTRPYTHYYYYLPSDCLNVSSYQNLLHLSVHYIWLTNEDEDSVIWKNLPRSLQQLEVIFDDDFGYGNLTNTDGGDFVWFLEILSRKASHFPNLKRMRFVVYQFDKNPEIGWEDEWDEEDWRFIDPQLFTEREDASCQVFCLMLSMKRRSASAFFMIMRAGIETFKRVTKVSKTAGKNHLIDFTLNRCV